jgi:hypothetical protein
MRLQPSIDAFAIAELLCLRFTLRNVKVAVIANTRLRVYM